MKTLKPVNQKSVYHSFSDLYVKIMNDEISDAKAETAVQALAGMNRTFALEIKRAEVEHEITGKAEIRIVESKNFDAVLI